MRIGGNVLKAENTLSIIKRFTVKDKVSPDDMDYSYENLSVEKLKTVNLVDKGFSNTPVIEGVYYKKLVTNLDGRGDLTELWSMPWSMKEPVRKNVEHVYYNTTHEGIVKGWHIHEKTYSQYTCVSGKMQVVLVDVREKSPSFGFVNKFVIGTKNPALIVIPPGVLKAWKSLLGDSVVVNILTSSDVSDNYKYPWDSILSDIWEPKNG